MNILFSVDRNYLEHLSDCICSITRFPSEDGYDFYIMHSDLRPEDEIALLEKSRENVRIHFIYVALDEKMDLPESERYPIQIYYRIFAAAFLPVTIDRILYLDVDTIVINSLNVLYKMDFEGNYILACTHVRKVLNKINQVRLGIKNDSVYINTGVMLINLELLRKEQDFGEVVKYVEKNKNRFTLPDQDIITALYGEKIGLLDTMIYNLSDRMLTIYNSDFTHKRIDLDWIRKNTVIIHYYGKQKPWNSHYRGILDTFYRELKLLKGSV